MEKKKKINQVIIFVFGISIFLIYPLMVFAESKVISDNNISSLAGFKVHTVILKSSDPAPEKANPVITSSVSTKNQVVTKNRPGSRVIDNNSSNVISTNDVPQLRQKVVRIAPQAIKTNNNTTESKSITYPEKEVITVKKSEPTPVYSSFKEDENSVEPKDNLNNEKSVKPVNNTENPLPESIVGKKKPIKEPSFTTLVGSLGVVIVLMLVFAWLYGKLRDINTVALLTGKLTKTSGFKLLSTTSLGQGKSIHLVEIKGKQLVIGSTANNVNLLTEFNGKAGEITSEIADIINKSDEQTPEISDVYKEYLNKDE